MSGGLWIAIITLVGKLLTNDDFLRVISRLLDDRARKPDNALNPEFNEVVEGGTALRMNGLVPEDGNVVMPQAAIDSVKVKHRGSPTK